MDQAQNQEVKTQNTEEKHAAIRANFDNKVDIKDFKFHFKKVKDEETGIEVKRPTVELSLPVPSIEGIISILESGDEKQQALLLEAVQEVVVSRARELVNDKEDITQDNFPMEELSWEKIANLPKAERRGGGISKEVWEAFGKDYVAVMPALTGKTAEQIGNAVKIYLNKFQQVKTAKPILRKLEEQLQLYAANTPNLETYSECVEFLLNKAKTFIEMDDSKLLENL